MNPFNHPKSSVPDETETIRGKHLHHLLPNPPKIIYSTTINSCLTTFSSSTAG